MRRGNRNGFLFDDDGVIALNLGSDYCAEHEWGIKETRRAFGMKDDGYGVERRRIHKVPATLTWATGSVSVYRNREHTTEAFSGPWLARYADQIKDGLAPRLDGGFYDQTLWTGWSDGDMGAFSTDAKETKRLQRLYDAIQSLDACIWRGGGGVFENAGLVIGITSRIPKKNLDEWDSHDRERERLLADAKLTGIEERIKKAGLGFYALSPARRSDGSIHFWLNPNEQHIHNFGWFTVADLDEWTKGRGPVVKKGPSR